MCLDNVDLKPKKHTVGYKNYDRTGGNFTPPVMNCGEQRLGETYDAKQYNGGFIESIRASDSVVYEAGFHYYLRLKDAKKRCGKRQATVRVLVKNVLATGKQDGADSGVSEFITLDRVCFDGVAAAKRREKADRQLFLDLCTKPVPVKVIELGQKSKLHFPGLKEDELKKFVKFVAKTEQNFIDFVKFIDLFPRMSSMFRMFIKIHMWAHQNDPDYQKFYRRSFTETRNKFDHYYSTYPTLLKYAGDIDKFVMQS